MNDEQLLRYSRQIMLPQVDVIGQQILLDSTVMIVGAGGLGSPAAMYLAAAGIGRIVLYDHDQVELTNLQRQISHHTHDIGMEKVFSTLKTLKAINPDIEVIANPCRLEETKMPAAVRNADIVLDCSDNFLTRFALNRACVMEKTPLVSGAAIRFEGQISVFVPGLSHSPCYNCLYQSEGEEAQNCARNGVISPITGIIGSMQALEAMKQLMGIGETLTGRLMLLDGLRMEWQTLKLKKNPRCPTCGEQTAPS